MPNPTRQEIIEAHEALTNLLKLASNPPTAYALFNERAVRDALPPKPQPTMAEVEWDDGLHYLAEAESARFGKVVMLSKSWAHEQIDILVNNDQGIGFQLEYPADLTPTGKRYTLTEVQE